MRVLSRLRTIGDAYGSEPFKASAFTPTGLGKRARAGRLGGLKSRGLPEREQPVIALVRRVYWPYIAVGYVQLALHMVLLAATLLVLTFFGYSFYADVSRKVAHQYAQATRHIEQCQRDFRENRCFEGVLVVPHMREQCQHWERCSKQTPAQLVMNRASLIMETLAETVNGFMDSISYKSIACMALMVVLTVMMGSSALSMARMRLNGDVAQLIAIQPPTRWTRRTPTRTRSFAVAEGAETEPSDDEAY
ncbi:hypothetical protein F1559_005038 [Cyanidiococcus yangmingshanensis]|uniref:Brl1/Brr6 domain-containing protein n=1 Tax=Cyanidiococcus yangmingshanensis TaxID=2690220 RepID=A0A7J7IQQ4_9RHOD|nr:hypothetical protein F1559_005038 [Cyanidiococcus yangmingshanensis]